MIAFLIYQSYNIYSDFKTYTTSNIWHFIFFIYGFFISWQVYNWKIILGLFLALFIGLLREQFKIVSFAAGDTKMICVVYLLIVPIITDISFFLVGIWLHIISFLFLFLSYTIFILLSDENYESFYNSGAWNIAVAGILLI